MMTNRFWRAVLVGVLVVSFSLLLTLPSVMAAPDFQAATNTPVPTITPVPTSTVHSVTVPLPYGGFVPALLISAGVLVAYGLWRFLTGLGIF